MKKIWIDDIRVPPNQEWIWIKSVKDSIQYLEQHQDIEILSLDHDSGDFSSEGGDYIKILDWMEETGRNYPVRFHTMNIVGRENMLRIANRNGWEVIP